MDWKLLSKRLADELHVPSAICGGAARDTILGGEVRDVDLYIKHDHWHLVRNHLLDIRPKEINFSELMNMDAVPSSRCTIHQQGEEEYDHQYIWIQEEFEAPGYDKPINLIGVDSEAYEHSIGAFGPKALCSLFNLTTSMAWFNFDGQPEASPDFYKSIEEKVCYITREDWGHEGTKRCAMKFMQKYGADKWWLAVPDIGVVPPNQAEAALDAWIAGNAL